MQMLYQGAPFVRLAQPVMAVRFATIAAGAGQRLGHRRIGHRFVPGQRASAASWPTRLASTPSTGWRPSRPLRRAGALLRRLAGRAQEAEGRGRSADERMPWNGRRRDEMIVSTDRLHSDGFVDQTGGLLCMTFSLMDAFLAIFIGMGPVKVLLDLHRQDPGHGSGDQAQIARRIVSVAGSVALGLFVLGAACNPCSTSPSAPQHHRRHHPAAPGTEDGDGRRQPRQPWRDTAEDPMGMAVSPLAIPLTLNPVGVVSLVIASSEVTDLPSSIAVVVLVWVVIGINFSWCCSLPTGLGQVSVRSDDSTAGGRARHLPGRAGHPVDAHNGLAEVVPSR